MIVVGIDPGVVTGFAVWDSFTQKLARVESMKVHRAMNEVEAMHSTFRELFVIFEDARQRRWFGRRDRNQDKYGAGVREGAGSIKRDSTIWEDFLTELGVAYLARSPKGGATKWSAAQFEFATKWTGRTNEHARDAALIVYGLNLPTVQAMVRDYNAKQVSP